TAGRGMDAQQRPPAVQTAFSIDFAWAPGVGAMDFDVVAKIAADTVSTRSVDGSANGHAQPVGNEAHDVATGGLQARFGKAQASARQRRSNRAAARLGVKSADDRPHFNATTTGLNVGRSGDLNELQAAAASLGFELAVALLHYDGATAGFQAHGLPGTNSQTSATGTGRNGASNGVNVNSSPARGGPNIPPPFAHLNAAATAGCRYSSTNLVQVDAAAAGCGVYLAGNSRHGDRAASGFQAHQRGLHWDLYIEINGSVVAAFTLGAKYGDLARRNAELDSAEFAARGFFRAGAHSLTHRVNNRGLLGPLHAHGPTAGNHFYTVGGGNRALYLIDPFVARGMIKTPL